MTQKSVIWSTALFLLISSSGCFWGRQNQVRLAAQFNWQFTNFTFPNQSREELAAINRKKKFPDDVGWINIKQDFGAKGDGKTDDTQAIQAAIAAAHSDYTRPKLIYFPSGTYLVTETFNLARGEYTCCVTFQGQGRDKTVIRLQDKALGFNNTSQPKALIKTRKGNSAFRHYFRDLTIDTGKGNPGAIGIDYVSNNRGAIKNVKIKSSDGQGQVGLAMIRKWPGPSLIKNVTIEGFNYGIQVNHPEYGLTFENISLTNQHIAGILNQENTLAIRNLNSVNTVPVIQNQQRGLVIVINGNFQGGETKVSAIENQGYLYARNIKASGYQSVLKNQHRIVSGLFQTEYISHPVYSLFDSPQHSLNLPIEETPTFHDNNLNNWANVQDYPDLQAALNSGKSTIYFPKGNYKINGTFNVPSTVRRIIGFESLINLNRDDLAATFQVNANSNKALIIEGLVIIGNQVILEHNSPRTVVIKHTHGLVFRNSPQVGKLFLEDVEMKLSLDYPQDVWARQLNAETLIKNRTKVINNGGNLWILGIKTEGKGTVIETNNGGKTELLGTLIYPVQKFTAEEKQQAAFVNHDSSQSLIYSVSSHRRNRNYPVQVRESRNGLTKNLFTKDMQGKVMPLFVGY